MKYKLLAILAMFTPVIFVAPTVAQSNTTDPAVFLRGDARSCQGCDLQGADLSKKSRVNAQLRQANLSNANFNDANFRGAFFYLCKPLQ
jgi:Pentapeptide repeats (8 copies).